MDPSSSYAMQRLIGLKEKYDIAFACRQPTMTGMASCSSEGLMLPNHYSASRSTICLDRRVENRSGGGKTVVSSAMIER